MGFTLKEKAQQIQTEIRQAEAALVSALNHIRDYTEAYKKHVKKLELRLLVEEIKRREKVK